MRSRVKLDLPPLASDGSGSSEELPITEPFTLDKYINTSFDVVKAVYDNLDDINTIADNLDLVGELGSITTAVNTLIDEVAVLEQDVAEVQDHAVSTSNPHSVTAVQAGAEPALGNPVSNGMVLSSLTTGQRSWVTVSVDDELPIGGTTGQVLTKQTDNNGDVIWASIPSPHDAVTVSNIATPLVSLSLEGQILSATLDPANHSHSYDRDRANHSGTQSADTITDGTSNKVFTAAEKTKLGSLTTDRYVLFTKTGTLVANAEPTNRYYPSRTVTFTHAEAWLDTPNVGATVVIEIKEDGVTRATITIPDDNTGKLALTDITDFEVTSANYLTIKVTQVGLGTAGSNLNVRLKGI